jgi:hypothetical protein
MYLEAKYAGVKTKWFDSRNFTAEVRFLLSFRGERGEMDSKAEHVPSLQILDQPQDHGFSNSISACPAYSALGYQPNAIDATCTFSVRSPPCPILSLRSRLTFLFDSSLPSASFPNLRNPRRLSDPSPCLRSFWKDFWHPTWRVHEMMASGSSPSSLLPILHPADSSPSSAIAKVRPLLAFSYPSRHLINHPV